VNCTMRVGCRLCVQLQLSFDSYDGSLNVHVIQARRLRLRADNSCVDPYVKLCLLPGRRFTALRFRKVLIDRNILENKLECTRWSVGPIPLHCHTPLLLSSRTLTVTLSLTLTPYFDRNLPKFNQLFSVPESRPTYSQI